MTPKKPEAPEGSKPPVKTTRGELDALSSRLSEAISEPEPDKQKKQHARGKKTARERIDLLLDPGSFTEIDALARHRSTNFGLAKKRPYGDGVVTGYGTIDRRQVAVYSQDFTVFGGSLGEVHGQKIAKVQDFALRTGVPIIGFSTAGARASRRASRPSPNSPRSSAGMSPPPESFPRYPSSSGRARVALSTPPP